MVDNLGAGILEATSLAGGFFNINLASFFHRPPQSSTTQASNPSGPSVSAANNVPQPSPGPAAGLPGATGGDAFVQNSPQAAGVAQQLGLQPGAGDPNPFEEMLALVMPAYKEKLDAKKSISDFQNSLVEAAGNPQSKTHLATLLMGVCPSHAIVSSEIKRVAPQVNQVMAAVDSGQLSPQEGKKAVKQIQQELVMRSMSANNLMQHMKQQMQKDSQAIQDALSEE